MNVPNDSKLDRRRYPRFELPAFARVSRFFGPRGRVFDICLGGVRIYSDNHFEKGRRLEIDIFLFNENSIEATAKVVWIRELSPDSEAFFDIGLMFISLPLYSMRELKIILKNYSSRK